MKKAIIKSYINGLGEFLDENLINWESLKNQQIKIYYHDDEDLFRIGYNFCLFLAKQRS